MIIRKVLERANFKTIYYNFKVFPFVQAIKFPLLISRNTRILSLPRKAIHLETKARLGLIQIGFNNVGTIDSTRDKSVIQIEKGGILEISDKTYFGSGANISIGSVGKIVCMGNFCTTARSSFICHEKIIFGKNTVISWDCIFMDSDFHKIKENGSVINSPRPITIGDNVWFGCRVTVLKGANVPNGCVIAAGALVSRDLTDENSIYAGIPAKLCKKNITWEL